MRIGWFGHSSFYCETEAGVKIIMDPYESGAYGGEVRYAEINTACDIVTASHKHPDHFCVNGLGDPAILTEPGEYNISGIKITGVLSYHDAQRGRSRGTNVIFILESDGIRVGHFGDIGDINLDYRGLGKLDVVMVPVGGGPTIDNKQCDALLAKINPAIVLPMHFKTEKIGFDINTVEGFLRNKLTVYRGMDELDAGKGKLPSGSNNVYLLNPLR